MKRADAWPGRSRQIAARDVKVGDIVNVVGLSARRSTIVHVGVVDIAPDLVTIYGRQPFGDGFRDVTRGCLPLSRVELLIEDDDPNEDR